MTDQSRLTQEEREVLDRLADVWELFLKLPVQHPMHQQEFGMTMHQLQRLIMSRPTARIEGWVKTDDLQSMQDVPSPNQNPSHLHVTGKM